jgi:hypothetical protein
MMIFARIAASLSEHQKQVSVLPVAQKQFE